MIGQKPPAGPGLWQEKLRLILERRRGARLGEATVVSRQVHVSEPTRPQIVTILTSADAGEVFYGRTSPGEIIHLDVFHAVGEVDHRKVAAALRRALAGVAPAGGEGGGKLLLDYFDLVTATGGGRVTGDLIYGQKASLRAAHRNHVHVAGLLRPEQLGLLLPMVRAVEEEILTQGLEIRRVERVLHARWSNGAPMDLSAYSDQNDSWLKGQRQSGQGGGAAAGGGGDAAGADNGGAGGGGPAGAGRAGTGNDSGGTGAGAGTGGQSLRSGRAGAWQGSGGAGAAGGGVPGAGAPGGGGPGDAGAPGAASRPDPSGWDDLEDERRLQFALDLSRRLGSPDEVKRVLDELSRDQGWASLYGSGSSQAPFVIRQLEGDGLVKRELRGLRLTESGRALVDYLDRHLRDVKLRFRKLIRRLPGPSAGKGRKPGPSKAPPSPDVRYGPVRGTGPAEAGAWLGDVAVPETVLAALRRTRLEALEEGGGAARGRGLRIQRRDVHVYLRSAEQPLHICLLIDASASMAGRRILAAKHLARHLLVSTRDRVAVIAFQERDVRVHVPFTRDYVQVEEGLARIQPMGLTPLAHGLTQSLELIRESKVRRPLLLLITDGIPTVPRWTIDPLADALEAARQVGSGRIPFGCIGLQPSKRYLEELAKAAGGTLHVVEELDEEALVTIAHQERFRTARK